MRTKIWVVILVLLVSIITTNVLLADPGDYNVEGRTILLDGDGDTDIGSITDDNFILTVGSTAELTVTQTNATFGGNILNTGTDDITAGDDIFIGDDLGLTSVGSIISWNSGDITLTHAANKLTLGGATVEFDFANHELTNVDINSGDITNVTISGGLTWSAAQDLNNQNLTNIDVDSGAIDNVVLGGSSPVTLQGLDLDDLVAGDTLHASAANTLARLAKGSDGEVLTLASGIPSWAATGYVDADAIAAVEGEATLNLTGLVTFADFTKITQDGSGEVEQLRLFQNIVDESGLINSLTFSRIPTGTGVETIVGAIKSERKGSNDTDLVFYQYGGALTETFRIQSGTGYLFLNDDIVPNADGTFDLGKTAIRMANVWSDLVNGSDYGYDNNWRTIESDTYAGYPSGIAFDTGDHFIKGKALGVRRIDLGPVEILDNDGVPTGKFKNATRRERVTDVAKTPVFVVTDTFIEFQGRRITTAMFDDLINLLNGP